MPVKVEIATERGLQVLAAFSQPEGGKPPTYYEVCRRLGIRSTNALNRHVVNLERRGLIAKEPRKPRGIKVLPAGIAALEGA